ncbi:MAG: cyclic lactone autoinducer peptide [Oscillospiraceae bacterium]
MKKLACLGMKCVSCMALLLTIFSVNTTCFGLVHQPKMPQSLEKFRK